MTYSGTPKVTGVLDNVQISIVLAQMQDGKFALVTKGFSYISGSGSETDMKTCLTTEGKNQNCYPTFLQNGDKHSYRIYSINRPRRLLNFWTLVVGAYSSWALIRGWALIKFLPVSVSVVCLFCNNTINGNNKKRRCNKARFL